MRAGPLEFFSGGSLRRCLVLAASLLLPACVDGSQSEGVEPASEPDEPEPIEFNRDDPVPPDLRGVEPTGPYTWNNVVIKGGGFVTGVVFNSTAPNLIYARTDVGGAYRYNITDQRWVPITDWAGVAEANLYGIESIASDPVEPNRVYLAAGTYLTAGDGAMLASDDFGRTFTRHAIPVPMGGNALGRSMGERLAVDPNQPEVLYFGSRNLGLWRSANRATSWEQVTSFPSIGDADLGLSFVHFDRASGSAGEPTSTLYVGVATLSGDTLYRSTDAGATWSPVPGAPTDMMPHHVAEGANGLLYLAYNTGPGPNDIAGGELLELDPESDSWRNISPMSGGGGFGGVSVDASRPDTLMVTTINWWAPDEIYRSTDGGDSWQALGRRAVRDTLGAEYLRFGGGSVTGTGWMGDIEIDPFNRSRVLYITGQGIWWSDNITDADANQTTDWYFGNDGLEETVALDLVSPPDGAALLTAVGDIAGFRHDELDRPASTGMFTNPVFSNTTSIDFAELEPNIVARVGTNTGTTGNGRRGAYSTDGGETWTPFVTEPQGGTGSGTIAVSADGETFLWAAQGQGLTVSFSHDRGETWAASIGIPAPAGGGGGGGGRRIASDRVNPGKFYYLSASGVFVSEDGGESFAMTVPGGMGGNGQRRLRAVFGLEGEVWLISGGNLMHSSDGAASFELIPNVSGAAGFGFGMAAPDSDYPAIYLSGSVDGTVGIFRSDDQAGTFTQIDDPDHRFGYVGYVTGDQRSYGRVYLGTGGRGIVYGDLRE